MTSGSQDDPNLTSRKEGRAVYLAANRIDSRELFAAAREITISHGDNIYRLRVTSQNKLILTK